MNEKEELYAVYAEADEHNKPLFQLNMSFARLIDEIVVPPMCKR